MKIICNRCRKGIGHREDLLVVSYIDYFSGTKPNLYTEKYHKKCHAKLRKDDWYFFLRKPVNTVAYAFLIMFLFSMATLFFIGGVVLDTVFFLAAIPSAVLFFFAAYPRAVAYEKYVKNLPRKK